MTHADIIVQLISEHGGISLEEARFVFTEFRFDFPGPNCLDDDLTEKEAAAMLNSYRANKSLFDWIAQVMVRHGRRPLPSA